MTNERISLKEAYDNRDVIAQIAILKDKLDSIPDADLTNVVLKTGDQIIDGKKTFNDQMTVNDQIIANGQIVANGGVLFANNGLTVNGTLQVDGDIIQNGSAYDTHAEQVYTKNDLIVTRDEAVGGIAAGQLSGIRVKKYNGVDDLNLGVDNLGVMRVGDLGDEQPLATRDEASAMTSGALVKWDGVNKKMIAPASDVGSDTKPLKEVDGVLTPVANDLLSEITDSVVTTATVNGMTIRTETFGKLVRVSCQNGNPSSIGDFNICSGIKSTGLVPIIGGDAAIKGYIFEYQGNATMRVNTTTGGLGFVWIGFKS